MRANVPPSFEQFKQRILDILKNDHDFAEQIRIFRFGDFGTDPDKQVASTAYPLCYVSMPSNPVMYRHNYFPATHVNTVPGQKWEQEFWAVIVVYEGTPERAQRKLDQLTHQAQKVLSQNVQLRDKDGENPLCTTSSIMLQRRFDTTTGDLMDGMTVRVRTINYTDPFEQ